MPSRAPSQLQPYSGSYQDSTQVPPRQHFRAKNNVADASQGSCCAGEGGLSYLKCVDHCHLFFLHVVPEEEAGKPSLSGWRSRATARFSAAFLGDAHPIVEVRHDVGRASLRGVLKRLPEPSCETVQRLGVGCPAAGVLRRWRAVHHDRVDVFLPVSEPTGLRSSLQLQRRVGCSYHVPPLPGSLVYKNGHSFKHVGEACLLVSPSPFEVPPMLNDAGLVYQSVPGATEKKSRASKSDDVRINFCARVSQSIRSARAQHIVENNSRAHAVKKKTKNFWKR